MSVESSGLLLYSAYTQTGSQQECETIHCKESQCARGIFSALSGLDLIGMARPTLASVFDVTENRLWTPFTILHQLKTRGTEEVAPRRANSWQCLVLAFLDLPLLLQRLSGAQWCRGVVVLLARFFSCVALALA